MSCCRKSRLTWHIGQLTAMQSAPAWTGHVENRIGELDHHVRPRKRQAAAAAFDLARPVEALAAHRRHQPVERLRIFRVVELQDLRRTDQQATVITGHLEAVQRTLDGTC